MTEHLDDIRVRLKAYDSSRPKQKERQFKSSRRRRRKKILKAIILIQKECM
jgi:hypothetical protein